MEYIVQNFLGISKINQNKAEINSFCTELDVSAKCALPHNYMIDLRKTPFLLNE